ncbi:MAG: discoidin domain-containing protein [Planctomycetes bacterium]|nr:discoidin domain-containing protein [Planctomycetota bacterium]
MSRLLISWSTIVVLLGLGVAPAVGNTPFSLTPTFDVEIGNDAQIGPGNSSATGSGMGIRNVATRRRVSYATYDVTGVRNAGQVFLNVSLSNFGHDPGTVNVYGVLESVEHLVAQGINWNNAPGVKNNPTPPLDTDVVLDPADLTEILLTFSAPARGVRASTDVSQKLADFLNSDTNGFVALMLAPEGSANAIVRTIEMGADGGTRLQGEVGGQPVTARDPNPADQATDVYIGIALSWTPGTTAAAHNVYLGTSFADVNTASAGQPGNVVSSLGQSESVYSPAGPLAYGQTYYWRVDEVNGPPDRTVYRGNVWSFTTEPLLYRVQGIVAKASSAEAAAGPERTIDGSGLTGDLHGTGESTMWISGKAGTQPVWIQYEFDNVYKLREMWVWNYNGVFESFLGFGFKDVTIEYSANGTDWTLLKDAQFARAPGQDSYAHNTTVDFGGAAARFVKLTAKSNWGGVARQCGLSEVRFLYTPTYASHPNPAAGKTGVSPDPELQWRPGREAATHQVYFGTDAQAANLAATTTQPNYDPGPLDLAKTYYWKVAEVNAAQTPSTWPGSVWSFTTSEFLVVDDFESYTDDEGSRIYETWIDGWDVAANGSQVGYAQAPFAERAIVHGGRQAMPLAFDNSGTATYSEAQRTFAAPQDWTPHGVKTIALYFYGPAANTVGTVYAKIDGKKVAYAGAADDLKKAAWVQWRIDLSAFGTNLKSIKSLAIGVEGAGALGTLFLDDIQLRP